MLRFSIRTLLIATLVVGVLFGVKINRAQTQKRGRDWVARERGHVTFSHKYDSKTQTFDHTAELWAPNWLVDQVGIDFFDTVQGVILDNREVHDLEPITDLQSLRFFAIMIEIDDDLDFSPLTKLPYLKDVYLEFTHISAERLARLREMLPGVRVEAANHPPP